MKVEKLEKLDAKYGCIVFLILWTLLAVFMLNLAMKADRKRIRREEMDQKIEQIWKYHNETKTE